MAEKKEVTKLNKLCSKCSKKCKQTNVATLISCPSFKPKPVQLYFNFKEKKSK